MTKATRPELGKSAHQLQLEPTLPPSEPEKEPRRPFEHYCWCGKWGSFGFGVNLRAGKEGEWFCGEHRPDKPHDPPKADS